MIDVQTCPTCQDWIKRQLAAMSNQHDPSTCPECLMWVARQLGGAGSGHSGHGGRPGHVGGSAPKGAAPMPKAGVPGAPSGGAASAAAPAAPKEKTGVEWKQPLDKNGRPIPIKPATMDEAVQHVLDGKVVEMGDAAAAHTLVNKLADYANQAKAKGEKAKDFDLCKVSVKGTNLFCAETVRTAEHPEGISRIAMPQMSGKPTVGSRADLLPKNKDGEVNGAAEFMQHLKDQGIKTMGTLESPEQVLASHLRASQREMVGTKVAGMMNAKNYDPAKVPIFVSRDNYVVDGHHRWAAVVGRDAADNKLGDIPINVIKIDAPITEVLHMANKWAIDFGIAQKGGPSSTAKSPITHQAPTKNYGHDKPMGSF